jgi:hypothetical protein
MISVDGLSEILDKIKPWIEIIAYPAAVAVILPHFFLFDWFALAATIITTILHELGHLLFANIIVRFMLGASGLINILFSPYVFIGALAGTIGYTLPFALLALYYLSKEDCLAAGAYLSLLSISINHMAWYCGGAINEKLPLPQLGQTGSYHDWYVMLSYLYILWAANYIAGIFQFIAYFTATSALILGSAYLITKDTNRSIRIGAAGGIIIAPIITLLRMI